MANTQHTQGPGQRVFSIGQRIVTLLVEMVETRLRLVVVELEEEKANLFQLLIMTGLTLLFAAFGLMSLLVLVIWAVDAQYRLHVMIATTVVLLLAAAIVGILTLRKARRSTLLRLTRKELENDRALLRRINREWPTERERQRRSCCARSSSNGWSSAPAAVTGTRRLRPSTAAGIRC